MRVFLFFNFISFLQYREKKFSKIYWFFKVFYYINQCILWSFFWRKKNWYFFKKNLFESNFSNKKNSM